MWSRKEGTLGGEDRPLSMVDIFEPLTEQEIEQLDGRLPDRHLEWGQIVYGPEDQTKMLAVYSDL